MLAKLPVQAAVPAKLPLLLALLAVAASLAGPAGLRAGQGKGRAADETGAAGAGETENRSEGAASDESNSSWQDALFLNVTEDASEEHALAGTAGACPHSDKVNDPSQSCAARVNSGCSGCALYHKCRGHSVCIVNGYLIVAGGSPLRGMEDISGRNARHWDYLWSAARHQCGSNSCVLISNPINFRTQHQMHLHYRHYNGGGASVKHRLEQTLCGTRGWRHFSECGSAKARLYSGMPGVFSAVAGAYGGRNLANVGITVWFTSACGGGQKAMLLATTHCSIEHAVSSR